MPSQLGDTVNYLQWFLNISNIIYTSYIIQREDIKV